MSRWIRPDAAGSTLSEEEWSRRHRWVSWVASGQALGLALMTLFAGHGAGMAAGVFAVGALPVLVGVPRSWPRRLRTVGVLASLTLAAGTVIPISGSVQGFAWVLAMTAVAGLYQDWVAFPVVALALVVNRGTRGWWGVDVVSSAHGSLIAAASLGVVCAALLASWRLGETAARTDHLTGLGNRLLLREAASRMFVRSRDFSLVFLDVRGFQVINDTRGHAFGDLVIIEIADRLRSAVRSADLVVRLAGDEFAVLVPGTEATAASVARRVVAALQVPVQLTGRPLTLAVAVGMAHSAVSPRADATELMRSADLALHQSSAEGRNRVVAFVPGMGQRVVDRTELAEDMVAALAAGDQFEVFYQPVVSLPCRTVSSHEALLRWNHPTRGSIAPLDFVPLAEETGAIVPIGSWVLQRATRDAAVGLGGTDGPSRVAVNVSAVQLAEESFVQVVSDALAASGLPADRLTVEVTESLLVGDTELAVARLQALRELGVRVAIDDFGTGYSSLSYLRSLPADVLKIDRSFVTDLARGGAATTLVSSIVELARSLSMDVVAEGVETGDQQAVLADLGCGLAQGYLFGRPEPLPVPAASRARPARAVVAG